VPAARAFVCILALWFALFAAPAGATATLEMTDTPTSAPADEIVFLLHGIGKLQLDMVPMEYGLRQRGFHVVNWKYPSRKHPLDELADQLDALVRSHPAKRIHFVTHSMGGIVVRTYLARHKPANVGRLVMIAPPSQGAWMADKLGGFKLYKDFFGPAGQQLRQGGGGACAGAGVPDCEFGIIAGGVGYRMGMNPFLPGDNDGTVSIEEAKLPGAADFIVLPYPHLIIQAMPRTIRNTAQFLKTGRFLEQRKGAKKT
jgi:pimeloyl-ACP methyl ester carboxylesterase